MSAAFDGDAYFVLDAPERELVWRICRLSAANET